MYLHDYLIENDGYVYKYVLLFSYIVFKNHICAIIVFNRDKSVLMRLLNQVRIKLSPYDSEITYA